MGIFIEIGVIIGTVALGLNVILKWHEANKKMPGRYLALPIARGSCRR